MIKILAEIYQILLSAQLGELPVKAFFHDWKLKIMSWFHQYFLLNNDPYLVLNNHFEYKEQPVFLQTFDIIKPSLGDPVFSETPPFTSGIGIKFPYTFANSI